MCNEKKKNEIEKKKKKRIQNQESSVKERTSLE